MKGQVMQVVGDILSSNGYGEGLAVEHIKYNADVNNNFDYQVIRESTHDGTLFFTQSLVQKAVLALINKTSYYKPALEDVDISDVKDVSYEVGDLDLKISHEGHKQTDIVTIPVKFYWS